jgi:glycine/D-amino acid oxidase-like deaminating enzyme
LGAKTLEADRVVWACGSWLGRLFPGIAPVRATRQDVFFYEAGEEWRTPGWVDYDGAFYGHGSLDGLGVKTCPDAEGPPLDPDGAREPGPGERAAAYLAHRFPALEGAPLRSASACAYELTPDTQFLAAPHPEHPNVWIYGGGSGHGFKHGPALAERMAAWLAGDEPPEPRFGLHPRAPETSLRTAGS